MEEENRIALFQGLSLPQEKYPRHCFQLIIFLQKLENIFVNKHLKINLDMKN